MSTIHYAIYKGTTYKYKSADTSGSFKIDCCGKSETYKDMGSTTL